MLTLFETPFDFSTRKTLALQFRYGETNHGKAVFIFGGKSFYMISPKDYTIFCPALCVILDRLQRNSYFSFRGKKQHGISFLKI